MAAARERDVQRCIGGQRAVVEHPVVREGADARERAARRPSLACFERHRRRRVPAAAHSIDVPVVESEPHPRLIAVSRIEQFAPRRDAAQLPQNQLEPPEPRELVAGPGRPARPRDLGSQRGVDRRAMHPARLAHGTYPRRDVVDGRAPRPSWGHAVGRRRPERSQRNAAVRYHGAKWRCDIEVASAGAREPPRLPLRAPSSAARRGCLCAPSRSADACERASGRSADREGTRKQCRAARARLAPPPVTGRVRVSFGSIAPLLVLVFAVVIAAGITVRFARAVRARTTRADGGQRAPGEAMTVDEGESGP